MELKLSEIGPQITEADIQSVEAEMDVIFPADYRNFLLEHNGGMPEEDVSVDFLERDPETGEAREQGCDIQFFSELGEVPEFYENLIAEELIPPKYLSVASDSFGNELLLCADGSANQGKVFFGNHEWYDPKTERFVMSLIADSFTEFLEKLEPLE